MASNVTFASRITPVQKQSNSARTVSLPLLEIYVGSGKTYTMLGTEEQPGLMVRVLTDLFDAIQQRSSDQYQFTASISYVEVCTSVSLCS